MTHRSLAATLALTLAAGCSRDFVVPSRAAPQIASVALVSPAPVAVAPLPVLAGQLVEARGTFPSGSLTSLQVSVGNVLASVVAASDTRVVFEVPQLATTGRAELAIQGPTGRAVLAGAVVYKGPGAPAGLATASIDTRMRLTRLVPVTVPDVIAGALGITSVAFAFALGIGDSATLLLGTLSAGVTAVPMSVFPLAAAARLAPQAGGAVDVEITAVDSAGHLGRGATRIEKDGTQRLVTPRVVDLSAAFQLDGRSCSASAQLGYTTGARHLVAVTGGGSVARVTALDPDTLAALGGQPLPAAVSDWAPVPDSPGRRADAFLLASGGEVLRYDAAQNALATFTPGGRSIRALVGATGCGLRGGINALAISPDGGRLAVAFSDARGAGSLAEIDLAAGALVGFAELGPPLSALAYAPVDGQSVLVAATPTALYRLSIDASAPFACGAAGQLATLAVTASSSRADLSFVAPAGGLAVVPDGARSRLLVLPAGADVDAFLPDSLASLGTIFRPASYGRVFVVPGDPTNGGEAILAEHTYSPFGTPVDTASTGFLIPFDGSEPFAAGGPAYGRGVAFTSSGRTQALLVGPQLLQSVGPSGPSAAELDGALSFNPGACALQGLSFAPVARSPDCAAQSPDFLTAWFVFGDAVTSAPAGDPCVSSGACKVQAQLGLAARGQRGLDLTPSADGTLALRALDLASCPGATTAVAQLVNCPVAPALTLVSGAAATTFALPAAPRSVLALPTSGFLVSVPCGAGGGFCDDAQGLCADRRLFSRSGEPTGAVLVVSSAGDVRCLAAGPGLDGAVGLTPSGAQLWIAGESGGNAPELRLTRLALPRSSSDGALDLARLPTVLGRARIGAGIAGFPAAFDASGIAFASDGSLAIVTVPAENRAAVLE